MNESKLNKSWEKVRDSIHAPEGVEELKKTVKYGLSKKYAIISETMFEWRFEGEQYQDMQIMSRDTVPEKFYYMNGQSTAFEDPSTGQVHILPLVMNGGFNIYGQMNEWSPVPIGYTDMKAGSYPEQVERIRNLRLNSENSVLLRNDLFGTSDKDFVDMMVNELVDNMLTLNQLQLIASNPIFFKVTQDNLLTAKNVFLAMSERRPVVFQNSDGEDTPPETIVVNVKIDPTLLELFDRWECVLLETIGLDCVPITKRAQQTVSEVESNNDKIRLVREGKLRMRVKAAERIQEMFGGTVSVKCLVNDWDKEEKEITMNKEVSYDDE